MFIVGRLLGSVAVRRGGENYRLRRRPGGIEEARGSEFYASIIVYTAEIRSRPSGCRLCKCARRVVRGESNACANCHLFAH